MIDTEANPARYIKLMALVVVLGLISALVTFAFMVLVHQGIHLVWEQAAQTLGIDRRLFTLLVCTLGGLVVGLLVKLFGDHSGIFAEVMLEFGKTGRFDCRKPSAPAPYRSDPGTQSSFAPAVHAVQIGQAIPTPQQRADAHSLPYLRCSVVVT